MDSKVKREFPLLACGVVAAGQRSGGRLMPQPRLLLIDDEPALADFLASAARESGFDPLITGHDDEFREAFLAKRPDMVALDLGMPGLDGVELLRFLAEQNYHPPVQIASGFDPRGLDSPFPPDHPFGPHMAGPPEIPVMLAMP